MALYLSNEMIAVIGRLYEKADKDLQYQIEHYTESMFKCLSLHQLKKFSCDESIDLHKFREMPGLAEFMFVELRDAHRIKYAQKVVDGARVPL